MQSSVSNAMTRKPFSMNVNAMAVELMNILENKHIDDIPVVDDENIPVGVIDIQDLPRFKLM